MERYRLNLTGAIYGWEVSPKQVGRGRLPYKTPIRGLVLSGHWTQSGGVYGVIASGLQAAQEVAGYVWIVKASREIFPDRWLVANGLEAWVQAVAAGYEGMVAKDEASLYEGRGVAL